MDAFFAIDASNHNFLLFPPDYNFTDSDQNNSYEVDIQVVDTAGNTASQSISVVVQNMIDLSTFIFSNAEQPVGLAPLRHRLIGYTGTDLAGKIINTQGIQEWTVPSAECIQLRRGELWRSGKKILWKVPK